MEPRNALVARADVLRWTEGYIAASERPWRWGPRRGRSAWHACGWVSREPGRPHRLHLKGCRGAGTGSPSPRPWTWHLASDGANPRRCSDGTAARRQRSAGEGRRGIGASHSTGEAGESGPRDPVEGRGRRQMEPLEGTMANTPRLDPISLKRQRIAELARQASDMVFTSLAHHIDRDMLHAAYVVTRKDGAVGPGRTDGGRVCGESGGQPPVAARPLQVRPVCRASRAPRPHPERGWPEDSTNRDTDVRGQGAAASRGDGAGKCLRAGLPGL